MKKYISIAQAERLISAYLDKGGQVTEIEEGVLGLGVLILSANGRNDLKEFVISEEYLNEWSSVHALRTYTKGLPKKYANMVY